jgi:hypothetical protein
MAFPVLQLQLFQGLLQAQVVGEYLGEGWDFTKKLLGFLFNLGVEFVRFYF